MMRYLGVDFGLKRVGLAISEGQLASPWKIIEGKNLTDLVDQVAVFAQDNFDKVVVGLPEGETGRAASVFIKMLQKKGLNVVSSDETLSTQTANQLMINLGVPRKKRRLSDAQAAAEILQNYLDAQSSLRGV